MSMTTADTQHRTDGTEQIWSADRKVDLVLEGLRGNRSTAQLCREAGISPTRYNRWKQQFVNAGRAGFTGAEANCQTLEERLHLLEAENARLQRHLRIFQEICLPD